MNELEMKDSEKQPSVRDDSAMGEAKQDVREKKQVRSTSV
jgi:hypothetical protein